MGKQLEIERIKLQRLIDEALRSGTPITDNKAILEQSRKVDELLLKTPMLSKQTRKKQQER